MLGAGTAQAADANTSVAQRALDIQAIQNVMGMHVWYHASYLNDQELDNVWVKTKPYTETAVWAQNSNYWQGMDAIRAYYGPTVDQKSQPGAFQFHTLTSPVIEVAADRKTAKGVWYTPGIIGSYQNKTWLWERYGVDFVNEDGEWKIWHLHVYTDFGAPMSGGSGGGGPGGDQGSAERFGMEGGNPGGPPPGDGAGGPPPGNGAGNAAGGPPPGGPGGGPGPGLARNMQGPSYNAKIGYRELGATSYPVMIPRPPVPYKTFSETWSYADPDEYANALKAIDAE